MNIDELIKDSIAAGTHGGAPAPDLDRIHGRGRRRSAVRVGATALATLGVVVAGAVAVRSVDDGVSRGQVPASIQQQGPATTYLTADSMVHLKGHALTARHAPATWYGGAAATVAGFLYIGDDRAPHLLAPDGAGSTLWPAEEEPGRNLVSSVAADATGRYAAWESDDNGRFVLNLFDAASGRITDRESIDLDALVPDRVAGDAASIDLIADRVVYIDVVTQSHGRQASTTIAWDPSRPDGERAYRATGPGTDVAAVADKTILVIGDGDVLGPDGSPLGDDWTIVRADTATGSASAGILSPDGAWRVQVQDQTRARDLTATNVHTGETVGIGLDWRKYAVSSLRMDDDGSLLVMASLRGRNARSALWDCDPPTGICKAVANPLDGRYPEFPGDLNS